MQATCRTALWKSDEIIELTPAVSDSYRGIGVRAPAGMSCPAGVVQKALGLAYLFPEFCGYDHAMRDIADSDIEYDLGEINTSISANEAHSNGLARIHNNSGDRDCLAASARLLLEARGAARCPHFVFPSAGYGAAFWQDEGVVQLI